MTLTTLMSALIDCPSYPEASCQEVACHASQSTGKRSYDDMLQPQPKPGGSSILLGETQGAPKVGYSSRRNEQRATLYLSTLQAAQSFQDAYEVYYSLKLDQKYGILPNSPPKYLGSEVLRPTTERKSQAKQLLAELLIADSKGCLKLNFKNGDSKLKQDGNIDTKDSFYGILQVCVCVCVCVNALILLGFANL